MTTLQAPTGNPGLTFWLYRPYLDLGPSAPEPPHHVSALDFSYRSVAESRDYPRLQASLNPSFRDALVNQGRLYAYGVESPSALADSLQSERWKSLCDWIRNFDDLDTAQQARVAWLLAKLCFFEEVLKLVPAGAADSIERSVDHASLAYVRAWARCRLQLDDPGRDYSVAEFERIATSAPVGIAQVDAYYQLVSQSVKYAGNLDTAEYWQREHLAAIERYDPEIADYDRLLLRSRYHRVGGFLPQMRQDTAGVVAEMQLAEDFARALPRPDAEHEIGADEMLFPVLESRIKEALWMGDVDAATERVREIVELSPHDPRAWLHHGQIHVEAGRVETALDSYRAASRLSPPGREIATFMSGQCLEALGDPGGACEAYLASLEMDPLAISSAEALESVAEQIGAANIRSWASERSAALREARAVVAGRRQEPYRSFAGPATASST